MSYNTRRSGNFGGTPANSVANVGQRRQGQPIANNFVPGGQLQQGNKPQVQQQYQQKPPPQQQYRQNPQSQQAALNIKGNQPPLPPQQQSLPPQQQAPPQPQKQVPPLIPQQTPPQPQRQVPQIPHPQEVSPQQQYVTDPNAAAENGTNGEEESDGSIKKKPFWMRKPAGKISKKERLRRRNLRLRKILQPKNALMVLNELVGNVVYNTSEVAESVEPLYKALVVVEGVEHVGIGKSKVMAKQNAAELAIKQMMLSKLKTDMQNAAASKSDEEGSGVATPQKIENVEMTEENSGTDATDAGISWSHVASYALHKLLTSWDEGGNLTERIVQATAVSPGMPGGVAGMITEGMWKSINTSTEKRPAKKLPENAVVMNPIMLLNQMRPNAVYDEVSKTGSPPNILFTMKCTTDNEIFYGTGSSKKAARKHCAYAACAKVLGIVYPPEIVTVERLDQLQTPMQMD